MKDFIPPKLFLLKTAVPYVILPEREQIRLWEEKSMGSSAYPLSPFTAGVNFTGWLEYQPADRVREDMYTRRDFENVRSLGCDVVRLPIHFERFCFAADEYRIPPKILGILDSAAAWTDELDMCLIMDFHNNTHVDSFTPAGVENCLAAVWTQLAERYRNRFPRVIFEIMNEPHGIETGEWNRIAEIIFRRLRSLDAARWLVVGGADWNSLEGMKALPRFEDDRIIYTFHFYDPHTFTHQGAGWSHMERVVRIPFPYVPERMPPMPENPTPMEKGCFLRYPTEGTVEALEKRFAAFDAFREERQAPVFCGEFGCYAPYADPAERVCWYRIVTGLLVRHGIPRISWDYYGPFGLFKPDPFREHRLPAFPRDLNTDLIEALRLRL